MDGVPATGAAARTVTAPDGTVIPLGPAVLSRNGRELIQDDAEIQVFGDRQNGYAVTVNNLPSDNPDAQEAARGAAKTAVEKTFAIGLTRLGIGKALAWGAGKLIGLGVGVVLDVFTANPITRETIIRSTLNDGTPVVYVILDNAD